MEASTDRAVFVTLCPLLKVAVCSIMMPRWSIDEIVSEEYIGIPLCGIASKPGAGQEERGKNKCCEPLNKLCWFTPFYFQLKARKEVSTQRKPDDGKTNVQRR